MKREQVSADPARPPAAARESYRYAAAAGPGCAAPRSRSSDRGRCSRLDEADRPPARWVASSWRVPPGSSGTPRRAPSVACCVGRPRPSRSRDGCSSCSCGAPLTPPRSPQRQHRRRHVPPRRPRTATTGDEVRRGNSPTSAPQTDSRSSPPLTASTGIKIALTLSTRKTEARRRRSEVSVRTGTIAASIATARNTALGCRDID